ncbi:MAG: helix-turn-helix domain-containing protein, partial [Pirellula sp.]
FYRVNVLSITIPPLRERLNDVPLLLEHLLGPQWKLGEGVQELFQKHGWPGNIRQLVNALERAKILADSNIIEVKNLPPEMRGIDAATGLGATETSENASIGIGDAVPMESISKLHITEVLKRNNGNKAKAARELGIARRSLYRMLEKFRS